MAKTIVELKSELARSEELLGKLKQERAEQARDLEILDAKISALSGEDIEIKAPVTVAQTRKVAPKVSLSSTASLMDVIKIVMAGGKAMEVADIAAAVKGAGYKSNAKKFHAIVNHTLLKKGAPFKRVGRGEYVLVAKKA